MNYPGLSHSLKHQLSTSEWELIQHEIIQIDTLGWHQNDKACHLLESAAQKAVGKNMYHCAAKVLYYYDLFFAN